ncbi:hypothetical protein R373_000505 [Salmonella enterica]|nr:hypothetical protein [Salmonella enterica]
MFNCVLPYSVASLICSSWRFPLYSPNLNPIERMWKLVNEHTQNNHCDFQVLTLAF